MFIDRARLRVLGGAGGNGCCSFRKEKYVPRGGPNGGDGGKGGDVYFEAHSSVVTLECVHSRSVYKAERGVHGQGSDCHGKYGEDLVIPVPVGTVVKLYPDETVVADLSEEGQRFLACRGGQGGRGNARFATATQRVPRFAEKGEPGEEAEFILELKLIAEVGIVGLPNAGKSTLLSRMTAARPKIANYPFTTLSPNLAVSVLSDYRTLTLADIPGIIEGAAQGKGLGHDFLRHIERTKILMFLVDLGDADPLETLSVLERELSEYSDVFADRPRVVVMNKADVPENRARFDALAEQLPEGAFLISAVTGEGIEILRETLWELVEEVREAEASAPVIEAPGREYVFEAPFTVKRVSRGFVVEGKTVLRMVQMTNFENEQAVAYLHKKFKRMGLFRALRRVGAQAGDTLLFGDTELEYFPDE